MTHSARRGGILAKIAPVVAGLMLVGGVSLMAAAPASATPSVPTAVVSDDNIDASTLVQPHGEAKGKKGDDCQGDQRCTPIKWCDGKVIQGKTFGNTIVEGGQHKPDCLKIPSAEIDDTDCCKAPPGGTIIVTVSNPNSVNVPVQVTIKSGDKERTKNGWAKPGTSVIKLKKLANGRYDVTVHLFDCVFKHGHKVVKIECDEVKPTPTTTVTVTPTATATATPTATQTTVVPTPDDSESTPPALVPVGNTTGGSPQLAVTGSNAKYLIGGGGLLAAGAFILFALWLTGRRNRQHFVTE